MRSRAMSPIAPRRAATSAGARGRGGSSLALFSSPAARAALFDDEEARKRIEETNPRLTQVQKQLEDRIAALEGQLKPGPGRPVQQVEQIKSDIAKLRGQVEVLTYELEQTQKRQRDLYVDLDSRVRTARRRSRRQRGAGTVRRAQRPAAGTRRRVRRAAPRRRARPLPRPLAMRRPSSARTTSRSTSSRAATTPPPSRASTPSSRSYPKSPLAPSALVLGRQRAVRAQGLPRGDRHAATLHLGVSRQPKCRTRCSTSPRGRSN